MTRRQMDHAPHRVQDESGSDLGADSAEHAAPTGKDTPIVREYRDIRNQYPDAMIFVRLGDFFELFEDDAIEGSRLLGLTLTKRAFGQAGTVPMCGVPFHSVSAHLRKLLECGKSIVLWDQVGQVVPGRLVERRVTRVLSPGMVIEGEFLEPAETTYCASCVQEGEDVACAVFDASTGDTHAFRAGGGFQSGELREGLARYRIQEIVLPSGMRLPDDICQGVPRRSLPAQYFDVALASSRLQRVLGIASLSGYELEGETALIRALGGLLAYAERAQLDLEGFVQLSVERAVTTMRLDAHTRRNLEIDNALGDHGPSVIHLLDATVTAGGARLLRSWIHEPLLAKEAIHARQQHVAYWANHPRERSELRAALRNIRDIARLVGRCQQRSASPKDLRALGDTLMALPSVLGILDALPAAHEALRLLREECVPPLALASSLDQTIVADPPLLARDGGSIRSGVDDILDHLHLSSRDAREYIAGLEQKERDRTGIRSLKVGYNRVFGYYLEVPSSQAAAVPAEYVRKQTLASGERYVTPELKEQESIVLGAHERAVARELEILEVLRHSVLEEMTVLLGNAAALAALDAAAALGTVADEQEWTAPELVEEPVLEIQGGRHPLVESILGRHAFVPNQCSLDGSRGIIILTGPNMAGKSTYLRQNALIVLLAHIGSFVPAARARIGLCDRIFTRIGAHDDLAGGLSTFMVEMAETAAILRAATTRSFVILDEIGRGTSTHDGLSLAQAIVEHVHDAPHLRCRTIFATHYHELTALSSSLPRVRNARVEVLEEGDEIRFLHTIVDGGADRSYGIHVAKLAGIPPSVIHRARQLLQERESQSAPGQADGESAVQMALSFEEARTHPVLSQLLDLDVNGLTPLAALTALASLQEQLDEGHDGRDD